MLCSWARHYNLTVPLSTQEYKWVPANCQGNLTKCWGVTCNVLIFNLYLYYKFQITLHCTRQTNEFEDSLKQNTRFLKPPSGLASHPGRVAIFLVASCYGNQDKLRWCGPLGLCTCARLYLYTCINIIQGSHRGINYI